MTLQGRHPEVVKAIRVTAGRRLETVNVTVLLCFDRECRRHDSLRCEMHHQKAVVVCFAVPLQGVAWGIPPRYLSEARSTPGRSGRP